MKIHSFEITIPVLNEESELEANVKKVIEFLSTDDLAKYNFRIVIADNGSTDNTPRVAAQLAGAFPTMVTAIGVKKRGVGLALKTSWTESKADIVGYMDLDLATDLKHICDVIKAFENEDCEILYGSRLHKDSRVTGRPLKREVTSRIFNFILKRYLGVTFSDGMCGFKFLKRAALAGLLEKGAESDNWFFSTELLTTAEWAGLKIKELPINWTDSPGSKVKILPLSIQYLRAMRQLKQKKAH